MIHNSHFSMFFFPEKKKIQKNFHRENEKATQDEKKSFSPPPAPPSLIFHLLYVYFHNSENIKKILKKNMNKPMYRELSS